MKDLFREAGAIIRADVAMFPDGRPKGTGIVVFETHEDAKNAVREWCRIWHGVPGPRDIGLTEGSTCLQRLSTATAGRNRSSKCDLYVCDLSLLTV